MKKLVVFLVAFMLCGFVAKAQEEGERIKCGAGAVYLVLNGEKHHIPNESVYNVLFADWNGIRNCSKQFFDAVKTGTPLDPNAILVLAPDGAVFLVNYKFKHGITSAAAMDKYHFNWKTARRNRVSTQILNQLADGKKINN